MRVGPIRYDFKLDLDCRFEVLFGELDGVELVESEPPDRQPGGRRQQQPVQQPQCPRILHVRVPSGVTEERMAQKSRGQIGGPAIGRPRGFLDQLGREPPETDGPDHILADSDLHRSVLSAEDAWVFGYERVGFPEPPVARMERLMPSECRLGRIDQPHSDILPGHGPNVSDGSDSLFHREINVFPCREAAQAEPDRLERRIPGDVHGEEDPGRFDRAGIAGAARGYRDRVHVDRDRLCIGTLETDISRIGESPRDVPDIVNAGEPRFQTGGQPVTELRDPYRLGRPLLGGDAGGGAEPGDAGDVQRARPQSLARVRHRG